MWLSNSSRLKLKLFAYLFSGKLALPPPLVKQGQNEIFLWGQLYKNRGNMTLWTQVELM
jgi:hypothetical protein